LFVIATAEPGDEESVTRAKYFIRDEFLVSIVLLDCFSVLGLKEPTVLPDFVA